MEKIGFEKEPSVRANLDSKSKAEVLGSAMFAAVLQRYVENRYKHWGLCAHESMSYIDMEQLRTNYQHYIELAEKIVGHKVSDDVDNIE